MILVFSYFIIFYTKNSAIFVFNSFLEAAVEKIIFILQIVLYESKNILKRKSYLSGANTGCKCFIFIFRPKSLAYINYQRLLHFFQSFFGTLSLANNWFFILSTLFLKNCICY